MIKIKYILWPMIVLLAISSQAQQVVDSSRIIRVLTFNILHGATMYNDFNLDVIAKVIIEAQPDLVALQEVDYKTKRAKNYDLATELGWRCRLAPIFARAMPLDVGEYGEGILSNSSLISSRNVALPFTEGKEPRVALEIVTKINDVDTIAFIGTHLEHTGEIFRVPQVKKLNEVFTANKYPSILAGDLNDIPGSEPIRILEELWKASYDKNNIEITYPSKNSEHHPGKKLDYIMVYPPDRWRILEQKLSGIILPPIILHIWW